LNAAELLECFGNLHFYNKEYQKAIPFFERAMQTSQEYDCARYHYLLGVNAEKTGRLTDAFKRYQAAIEIESNFVDPYVELGGLLFKIEDFEGTLQCYTDAIAIDPNDLPIRHNLIQVLLQLSLKDSAMYSQLLYDAQAAYNAAKRSLDPPDSNRVW